MRLITLAAVCFAAFPLLGCATRPSAEAEKARLQGSWEVVEVLGDLANRGSAQLTFRGDRVFGDEVLFGLPSGLRPNEGAAFCVDPARSPRWLDLATGIFTPAIYELDGDRLRIGLRHKWNKRLAGFPAKPEAGTRMLTLRRVRGVPTPAAPPDDPDKLRLQGRWRVVSVTGADFVETPIEQDAIRRGTVWFEIAGEMFKTCGRDGGVEIGIACPIRIDSTAAPKRSSGVRWGPLLSPVGIIYKLEGDTLTLCSQWVTTPWAEVEFPTEFQVERNRRVLLVLRRM